MAWLVAILILVPFSVASFGLLGAAWSYASVQLCLAIAFISWQWPKLGAPFSAFLKDAFAPVLLVIPGAVLSRTLLGDPGSGLPRVDAALHVLSVGSIITLSSVLVMGLWGIPEEVRHHLMPAFRRRTGRQHRGVETS
jgi:hypothetical protein